MSWLGWTAAPGWEEENYENGEIHVVFPGLFESTTSHTSTPPCCADVILSQIIERALAQNEDFDVTIDYSEKEE